MEEKKYIGVHKNRRNGRDYFSVRFSCKKILYAFGWYKDIKTCAKAYDMFVIKNQLDRKTNFIKKSLHSS